MGAGLPEYILDSELEIPEEGLPLWIRIWLEVSPGGGPMPWSFLEAGPPVENLTGGLAWAGCLGP